MSLVLPRSQWPLTDRDLWDALFREAGPLDNRGALAHVRQTTRVSLEPRYGRWMQWLATYDPASLSLRPAERASLPRLQAWLTALDHTRPMSRLAFIDGVLRILGATACFA